MSLYYLALHGEGFHFNKLIHYSGNYIEKGPLLHFDTKSSALLNLDLIIETIINLLKFNVVEKCEVTYLKQFIALFIRLPD